MAANLNPKTSKSELSARERFRRRTNYETPRYTGWAPIPFAAIAEIPRLSSGAAFRGSGYKSLTMAARKMLTTDNHLAISTFSRYVRLRLTRWLFCQIGAVIQRAPRETARAVTGFRIAN